MILVNQSELVLNIDGTPNYYQYIFLMFSGCLYLFSIGTSSALHSS